MAIAYCNIQLQLSEFNLCCTWHAVSSAEKNNPTHRHLKTELSILRRPVQRYCSNKTKSTFCCYKVTICPRENVAFDHLRDKYHQPYSVSGKPPFSNWPLSLRIQMVSISVMDKETLWFVKRVSLCSSASEFCIY